jgi:ABC-2 type transport system permease protein
MSATTSVRPPISPGEPPNPPPSRPSTRTTVGLVARREITTKLHDKTFLLGLGFMLAVLIGALVFSGVAAAREGAGHTRVATVGNQATQLAAAAGLETQQVPDKAAGVALLDADGGDQVKAVVELAAGSADGAAPQVTITADTSAPDSVVTAFSVQPTIDLLTPPDANRGAMIGIGLGFAVVFYFVCLTFGMGISQSVVEEKETRIVEILVAAIPVRALLAGKILGNSVLALGQVALLVLLAFVGVQFTGDSGVTALLSGSVGWFLAFFVLGFGIFASLWAVAGAVATRQEDLASTTLPLQLLLMIPFFVSVSTQDPNTTLRVLSYIPFTSPFSMPRRIVMGDVGWWQPTLSLALLAVGIVATIAVCTRIYSGALLQTTGKAKLRKAWTTAGS